jgi:hypothetical protein
MEAFSRIDFAAMERAYLAKRNFDFLVSAQNFTYDGDEEKFGRDLEAELKRYYMPMMSPASWPILSSSELDIRFTSNFDHMNHFLRNYVVPKNYGNDAYRSRVTSFQESNRPENRLSERFEIDQKVYVVQRERLHLYFVEENGTFRMLSVTNRVMD